jgi:hypothetical protein
MRGGPNASPYSNTDRASCLAHANHDFNAYPNRSALDHTQSNYSAGTARSADSILRHLFAARRDHPG